MCDPHTCASPSPPLSAARRLRGGSQTCRIQLSRRGMFSTRRPASGGGGGDEFRCQGRACEVGNRKGRRRGREGVGGGKRNKGDAGSGHAGGNATAGGRTTAHVASFHGAAATARRRKGEERRGREAPCVTTRRKEMALVWGGGREQRAEVGGPRRAAAASPLARACSGCRWGGVGRARSGHGVETLCASRSVRPPY